MRRARWLGLIGFRRSPTTDDIEGGNARTVIRVFVADDHSVVREGLKRLIEESSDMTVAGEAATGDELLARVAAARPQVLVLDISMPGPGFLDTMRVLREAHPQLKILVLSTHSEDLYAVRSFKAGAWGYLTKSRSTEELLRAIRRISNDGKYLTLSLAERLASYLDGEAEAAPHERLSDREYQVLIEIAKGRQVKEIGAELNLSPKTVSTYRKRIVEKMGIESTASLIRYAVENRLLDP